LVFRKGVGVNVPQRICAFIFAWWRARIGQVRCAGREGAQKKGGPEGPPKDDLTSGGIDQNFFDTVTP
jgi:hypothetical protein